MTSDTIVLLVWPSLVLSLTSVAIAIVGVNTVAPAVRNRGLPLHRNEVGGRSSLLAQVGLLICASILHASAVFVAVAPAAVGASSAGDSIDGALTPVDPQQTCELLMSSVYLTIFVNLAVSLAEPIGSITTKYQYCHPPADLMRSVSIATLGPMIFSTLLFVESQSSGSIDHLQQYSRWHMMMVSYVVSLLVAQFIQRLFMRRRGRRNVLVGIPLANGYSCADEGGASSTMLQLRPDRWHEWSPEEVAQWVATLPQLGRSGSHHVNYSNGISGGGPSNSSGTYQHYAALLLEECVDGAALGSISIDALRSLGLPYGHAAALRRDVDEALVARYGTGDMHLREEGAGLQHSIINEFDEIGGSGVARREINGGTVDLIEPQMAEQASQLFAQRFGGMKLARFQTGEESSPAADASGFQQGIVTGTTTSASAGLVTVDEDSATVAVAEGKDGTAPPAPLGQDLMSSMPPHVREVAVRNPELVRSMMLRRQNRSTRINNGSSAAANGSSAGRSTSVQSEVEMSSHWADDSDEEEEEEEEGASDTVGLLRRRPNR